MSDVTREEILKRVVAEELQPCESQTATTSAGCCADGRSCDELCIHVAAAAECRRIRGGRNSAGSQQQHDNCCPDEGQAPCSASAEPPPKVIATCADDCCAGKPAEKTDSKGTRSMQREGMSNDAVKEVEEPPKSCSQQAATCCSDEPSTKACRVLSAPSDSCLCCADDDEKAEAPDRAPPMEDTCSVGCCGRDDGAAKARKCSDDNGSEAKRDCASTGRISGQACQSHLESAFKTFLSYLESGRCICRSVLDPVDICCSQERRKSVTGKENADNRHGDPEILPKALPRSGGCSDTGKPTCSSEAEKLQVQAVVARSWPPTGVVDELESDSRRERTHVVLGISGMTCTGCASKGINVLKAIHGVVSPGINFMTSTGSFDVDSTLAPQDVISQLERETGFKCLRIVQDLQTLEVIMSKSEATQLETRLPDGIESISRIDKASYGVVFDPAIIGARSVRRLVPSGTLAPPRNDKALGSGTKELRQLMWSTISAALLTVPVIVLAWSNNPVPYSTRSVISIVLATCVQAIAVPEFYVKALRSLIFSKLIEMDMLVVISISAAFGYSVVAFALTHAGYHLEQGEFFETSTLLITLVLLGRLVSVFARMRALRAVSMESLQAKVALLGDDSGRFSEIDARLLEYGDNILIPPHSRVVTDGKIVNGAGSIDESNLTGESLPVPKQVGDAVMAGTMNGASPLTVRLTRLPGKNSISDIANLIEGALASKPHIQDLADKIASWFVPAVVGIAAVVLAIWPAVAFKVRNADAGGGVGLAFTYSIAVLAVSCPCALGLAVPMVLIIAGGVAAKSGMVIKHATATESAHRTTDVVFDKTGTLTTGALEVVEEHYEPILSVTKAKALVHALTKDNTHPVSIAVAHRLQNAEALTPALNCVQSEPGAGIQATWDGQNVKIGKPDWLDVASVPEISRLLGQGTTVLAVTLQSRLVAAYSLTSTLRPEARSVVQTLAARGLACHLVSGDGAAAVAAVAAAVGIAPHRTAARQTPASKQAYVRALMDRDGGRRRVLFCGDGTNDAVAVAQAHTGVQIGAASDVTRATADVVLTGGLDGLPALLAVSRRAFARIVLNFVWSAVYNVFAILLAAGAFVRVRIPPAYAGLGEIVSVLPVVLIALSLLWYRRRTA